MKHAIVYFADNQGWLLTEELTAAQVREFKKNPIGQMRIEDWEAEYVDFFVLPSTVKVRNIVTTNASA